MNKDDARKDAGGSVCGAAALATARGEAGPDAAVVCDAAVSLIIDGRALSVPAGTSILDAARSVGATIPTLCYLRNLNAIASCRVCVVEIEDVPYPVPACTTKVREGMVVTTDSEQLCAYRRLALDLIAADLDPSLFDDESSELAQLCAAYGVSVSNTPNEAGALPGAHSTDHGPVLDSNPFLSYNPQLCIRCQRCVGACNQGAHNHTLRTVKRGLRTAIEAPFGPEWRATDCESCGTCAQACPTGALQVKRRQEYRESELRRVQTTCPHCGVGCQLELLTDGNRILDAQGVDGPSNKGLLCVKGRSGSFDFATSPDRLRTPLVRNRQTGELEPASWDEALDVVVERFGDIKQRFGGKAIAAFACSRATNEDIYLFQKMARVSLQTNSVDSCARV